MKLKPETKYVATVVGYVDDVASPEGTDTGSTCKLFTLLMEKEIYMLTLMVNNFRTECFITFSVIGIDQYGVVFHQIIHQIMTCHA